MKLKVKGEFLMNEEGTIIAVFTEDVTEAEERAIELGSEAIPILENFVTQVNSGSFKPRAVVKQLEILLDKYAVT